MLGIADPTGPVSARVTLLLCLRSLVPFALQGANEDWGLRAKSQVSKVTWGDENPAVLMPRLVGHHVAYLRELLGMRGPCYQ